MMQQQSFNVLETIKTFCVIKIEPMTQFNYHNKLNNTKDFATGTNEQGSYYAPICDIKQSKNIFITKTIAKKLIKPFCN